MSLALGAVLLIAGLGVLSHDLALQQRMLQLVRDHRTQRAMVQTRLEDAMRRREIWLRESEYLIEDFAAWREEFAGLGTSGLARARPLLTRLVQTPERWARSLHGYLKQCLPQLFARQEPLTDAEHDQVLACLDTWQQAQEDAIRAELERLRAAVHETKQTYNTGTERLEARLDMLAAQLLVLARPTQSRIGAD